MESEVLSAMRAGMDKCIDSYKREMAKVRTGRAHAELLDHIRVDVYGSKMPLAQVANVNVSGPRSLSVSPWDKAQVSACEKAIIASNLGLNPSRNGDVLFINLPELTQDRRKDMLKIAKEHAENSKVSIRNIRRSALTQIKHHVKEKMMTEDDERRTEANINKQTETYISVITSLLDDKEAELMAV